MNDQKRALLIMDVQQGIINNLGDRATEYLQRVSKAVDAARQSGIPVIFVVVRFRKGYPELSPNNKMFGALRERSWDMDETSDLTKPMITPQEDELVIAKKRVSAFAGSDLEMILNARGITELILCGVSTSGVVLSTLRYAADKDYRLSVLSDCSSDQDEEVHRVLTEKVFPRQAEVLTLEQWTQKLNNQKTNAK
jgi:nicotinamidase-related amidase